mmetsp:Transcript_12225/g.18428  ORF Transcript_12225/g.18428 Transcript_12225/m.18428 type:complete len:585 (-) Transcript_12225:1540-3294(-)
MDTSTFIDRIISVMDVFINWIIVELYTIVLIVCGIVISYTIIGTTMIYCNRHIYFVDKDEQLIIENLTEITVVHGPKVTCLPPWIKSCEKKKVLSLSMAEYCVVKNILSGKKRIEVGPKMVFLQPYDHIEKDKYGEKRREAIALKANEYVRFLDNLSGAIRIEYGEKGGVVPNPDEILMDGGKKQAMDLQVFEYVKVQNKRTGAVRTERGEKLVYLGEFDVFLGSKKTAVEVDDETSVLIRNKRTGQQSLVTEKMLFIPSDDEEIIEVRSLIKLADYEACIVRDKQGKELFFYGSNDEQRSFFLPPHSEIVPLLWSRGRRRERRDLRITKIDLRPMYMSFEFNCRTNDNVELVLEGSFFWEVIDLEAMVKFTNDTTGDVCNHARSRFIEKVSKVTLQDFMTKFNVIAEEVHKEDESNFYGQRGVKIHSLEVTGYHCAEPSTAMILEQIIQETTNRMNRLQQQESENEVQLNQIRGDIDEEKARSQLLRIQAENSNARSKMEGMVEAERVRSFLTELGEAFPDMDMKTKISIWNTLRKEDALKAISTGNAKLYFTPRDVNLSIENHDHTHDSGSSWVDGVQSTDE